MISVVVPCYRVSQHILGVLESIGPECERIYVVDDRCPEGSGKLVQDKCVDPRVAVIFHDDNQGVGGATLTGYAAALKDGADILVKLDGDGQMEPDQIPRLVRPIEAGDADYTKGNRFYDLDGLSSMPAFRLFGNAGLSFLSKLSSGYWNTFDPTNGFTAIHGKVAAQLPVHKISSRWFFESDMLFRLGVRRAVVVDVPMPARYGDERSSMRAGTLVFEFAYKHLRNTVKRLLYTYYLRDFNVASIELVLAPLFLGFALWTGIRPWAEGSRTGELASAGTVMLAALPVILGVQLLLAFLGFDLRNVPTSPIHKRL